MPKVARKAPSAIVSTEMSPSAPTTPTLLISAAGTPMPAAMPAPPAIAKRVPSGIGPLRSFLALAGLAVAAGLGGAEASSISAAALPAGAPPFSAAGWGLPRAAAGAAGGALPRTRGLGLGAALPPLGLSGAGGIFAPGLAWR